MTQFPRIASAAIAASVLSLATVAAASPTKAWTVAKSALPADTSIAISVDVAAVAKSAVFTKLFPLAIAKNVDLKQGLELFKSACKMDPFVVIRSVVVGLDATQSDGAVFMAVPDITPAKLETCFRAIGTAKGATVDDLVMKTDHGITDMASAGKHLFVGWIGSDVLVMVPNHLDDRKALQTWMGGGLAKGALGKLVGKVDTGASVFVASTATKSIDSTHTLKTGYGSASFSGANLTVEGHGDFGDPAAAKGLASDLSTQLDQVRKNPPLPALASLMKNVAITQPGSEIVVKATVVDKELADLLALVLSM